MENPQRLGGGGVPQIEKWRVKIESGPVERQPLEERPNQPGARGEHRSLLCATVEKRGVTVPQG